MKMRGFTEGVKIDGRNSSEEYIKIFSFEFFLVMVRIIRPANRITDMIIKGSPSQV